MSVLSSRAMSSGVFILVGALYLYRHVYYVPTTANLIQCQIFTHMFHQMLFYGLCFNGSMANIADQSQHSSAPYWVHPMFECYLSWPPHLLCARSLSLCLRGEVVMVDPLWKFSHILATGVGVQKRNTRSLTLCQTPLPSSSLLLLLLLFVPLFFTLSFSSLQPKLAVWLLAANNGRVSDTIGCLHSLRQPGACLANQNTCILSSMWFLSLTPASLLTHPASLSLTWLWSACLSVSRDLQDFCSRQRCAGTCVCTCVSVCSF